MKFDTKYTYSDLLKFALWAITVLVAGFLHYTEVSRLVLTLFLLFQEAFLAILNVNDSSLFCIYLIGKSIVKKYKGERSNGGKGSYTYPGRVEKTRA
ncbi:MAG: hypothetical protein Kow00111_28330 [Thermincola ferriacetica]